MIIIIAILLMFLGFIIGFFFGELCGRKLVHEEYLDELLTIKELAEAKS